MKSVDFLHVARDFSVNVIFLTVSLSAVNHFEIWQSYFLLGGVAAAISSVGRTERTSPLVTNPNFWGGAKKGEGEIF